MKETSDIKEEIIILVNLGGPSSLDQVESFLTSLLSDPNVIQLPKFLRFFWENFLVKRIVKKRLPESKKLYQEIGGKSPIVELTKIQAKLLEKEVKQPVFLVMKHSLPNLNDFEQLLKKRNLKKEIKKVTVLPLYPQYSTTTTKSSFEELEKFFSKFNPKPKLKFIKSYCTEEKYIQAWTQRINDKLKRIEERKAKENSIQILFSAHGIPERYVKKGDVYLKEVQATVKAISANFSKYKSRLAFQSKFGPGKWLEPSVEKVILELKNTTTEILVVPVSFVSDHIETIHEIGIGFKKFARENNLNLHLTPGLNHSALFIQCLTNLIKKV